jgi:hypothetical protein
MCDTKNETRYSTKDDLLPNNKYVSKRIWRMRDMYLSVSGKYGKCRVVCDTQNRLQTQAKSINLNRRMQGKYICNYAYMDQTQRNFLRILQIHQKTQNRAYLG